MIFRPMLAAHYSRFNPGFAQPKLDGVRCLARAGGLFTRTGHPIRGVPHIQAQLAPFFAAHPDAILDGELYNHALRDDFSAIVRLVLQRDPDRDHLDRSATWIQYHVYDMPSESGGFAERYRTLAGRLHLTETIRLVETHRVNRQPPYDIRHQAWLDAGYEGSIWRADAPYRQGRSPALRKRKLFEDAEFACLAIEAGPATSAMAKRILCALPDGRTFRAGVEATHERARALLKERHSCVTVRFCGRTSNGFPRFPVAIKFWGQSREA